MTRSADEQEIRDAVVAHLRELYPDGRIIHELNCGHGRNRIDVANVTPTQIVSVEIKSKKDTLKRLADQVAKFRECSHYVIVAAHEKFFEDFTYNTGHPGFRATDGLHDGCTGANLWLYPRPDDVLRNRYHWGEPRHAILPDTRELLTLLWTDELRAVFRRMGYDTKGLNKTPGYILTRNLWHKMAGQEIVRQVCLALRARTFAEADPEIPIIETLQS